ncbi:MAG: SMP-30/gluconolactonase/LRE family protein [Bacteroidota bacterium]
MKQTLLIIYFFAIIFKSAGQQKPQEAFTVREKDIIAEGIAYDPFEKAFYLSSIQKSKILKITSKGEVSDFVKSGQDNIRQVLGMKVDASGRLWACNNTPEYDTINRLSNVHVFETKTGKLVRQYEINDGKKHLFNDLYFTATGDVYITDSDGGGVYVVRRGNQELEEFLKPGSLRFPNGITATPDESRLLVSTGSGLGIVSIDLKTKEVKPVSHAKFLVIGLDGLYRHGNSLIGIQNIFYPEAVMKFTLSANCENITEISFLTSIEPRFDIPTTGVIAEGYFYFIANSQLLQTRNTRGAIKEPEKLTDSLIMRVKL